MTRLLSLAVALTACSGSTDPTDSDLPLGCAITTGADTFDAVAPVGSDITLDVSIEARCRNTLTLDLSWRDPYSGRFTLPPDVEADLSLTLLPYEPQILPILFTPAEAGDVRDQLVLQSDDPLAGGIILTFRGVGQ